jgi:hypothetical protein
VAIHDRYGAAVDPAFRGRVDGTSRREGRIVARRE